MKKKLHYFAVVGLASLVSIFIFVPFELSRGKVREVFNYISPPVKLDGAKFLVAGQSNSVSPANGAKPIYSMTGLTSINNYYHEPKKIRVPTKLDPNDSGMTWIYLGDMLNRQVSFNVIGVGSTSTRKWVQVHKNELLSELRLGKGSYSAIIWVQGESDAAEGIGADESYVNLKRIIQESRGIQPGIPWYISLNGLTFAGPNPMGPARFAQIKLVQEGVARAGADLDILRKDPNNFEPSGGELSGPGFRKFARAWYEIIKNDMQ